MDKIDKLIDRFIKETVLNYEALEKGDYKKGNKAIKIINKLFDELKDAGEEGREALLSLTDNEREEVRLMASVYSLKYNSKRSLATLKKLTKNSGILGLEAQQAIENYNSGNWGIE